ncbi:modin [Fusarium albosuccineum]|uniref:Modin n=1 Tax=Fusarium albosuccineum TaxID=1237068 RepID=A0A8H4LFS6_9HYPO|nr:modin [Fusarium albosuccineum]
MSDSSNVASLAISVVALVVALVALAGTLAQVVQQYLATAVGYANCGEHVMGPWARHTQLKFRPWQPRFEVIFKAPVLFVTPDRLPDIGIGPDQDIYYLDSGWKADNFFNRHLIRRLDSRQITQDSVRSAYSAITQFILRSQSTVAPDVEPPTFPYSASWLALLKALQTVGPGSILEAERKIGAQLPHSQWKISWIAVQQAPYSLDLMPDGIKKPFALTTLGDLILMAAMLGTYWKEFNLRDDRYLADGNGYLLTGTNILHLGLMFTFQKYVAENPSRPLIPSVETTPYCFGFVPMFFGTRMVEHSRPRYSADFLGDSKVMKLWSKEKIAETLRSLGCNKKTLECFHDDERNKEHLFPIVFEVLGMLADTVHKVGLPCYRLPNPTPYRWNKESFCLSSLMERFAEFIRSSDHPAFKTGKTGQILASTSLLLNGKNTYTTPNQTSTAHLAVPKQDNNQEHQFGTPYYALKVCTEYLQIFASREIVLLIFRNHIDVVLDMLNKDDGNEQHPFALLQPGCQSLLETPLPKRQREKHMMHLYVNEVAKQVVDRTVHNLESRGYQRPKGNVAKTVTEVSPNEESQLAAEQTDETKVSSRDIEIEATEVWVVMMFRMMYWLWLHGFDRDDVQIPKSDLFGSKQPVYIS